MGTDDVTLPTLQQLHRSAANQGKHAGVIRSVDVLCPGDRPAGRGQHALPMPVKAYAVQHGLRTVEVPYGVKDLRSWDPSLVFAGLPEPYDLGVVVSFGYFLTPTLLDPLRLGAVNLHPSLLPKYRGAAPIPRAILAGETVTGLSIIDIHRAKFDAGAVLAQEEVGIGQLESSAALRARLAARGAELMMEVLAEFEARRAAARPQAEAGATRAPKIKPEEGAVAWDVPDQCTSAHLLRMWRAFEDSCGVYCGLSNTTGGPAKRIKLLELAPCEAPAEPAASESRAAGSLWWAHRKLLVRTSDGWLQVLKLQPEGKKAQTAQDFANAPAHQLKAAGWAPVRLVPVQAGQTTAA